MATGVWAGRIVRFFLCLASFFLASGTTLADTFFLRDGGSLVGELLNPDELPREVYRVKTPEGLEITLTNRQVLSQRGTALAEAWDEYYQFAPFLENTVENHLKISQWCSEKHIEAMTKLARSHLAQILELDPDHAETRKKLGYTRDSDGTWSRQTDRLAQQGLIRTSDGYVTQQQIEIKELFQNRKNNENAWERKIDNLLQALPNSKTHEEILAISDPAAVPALSQALARIQHGSTRALVIRTLSRIGSRSALMEIAYWSVQPQEGEDIRLTCFEELKKHPTALPMLTAFYISMLRPDLNSPPQLSIPQVNAAAFALSEFGVKSAVPDLIKVLVTHHSETRTVSANTHSVGNQGGMSFGQGSAKQTQHWESKNSGVFSALCRLTGQNFGYDQNAWIAWLLRIRQTKSFSGRRD